MRRPTVTVIMPVYNVEAYVGAAIESVLSQTFEDFELLIIDDEGQDSSLDICRRVRDSRIRIISQRNRGLAGARNTGIRYAGGRYLAFLDSDDLWHREKLERHVAHLEKHAHVGVSYSGALLIDEHGHSLGLRQSPQLKNVTARDIFLRNPVSNGSTPVIRHKVFADIARPSHRPGEQMWFEESLRQSEDVECWMRIALTTRWVFEGLPGDLTRYRVNSGGLSANIHAQYESWCRVRDTVARLDPGFARRWARLAEAFETRYLARRAVRMRDRSTALALTLKAFLLAPVMLVREPLKSLTTLGATAALNLLPVKAYGQLERAILKTSGAV
ncbi:glycosyltransferase family 2 protein [Maricaulis sp. D1M11]|uniref:glycosyltransferase family 2 protein n=1 Tax=Maricaulis sp. D1M11 TaxID=3076117 RepID=UPI0039B549DF